MELFQKLGADVELLWREKNYDEELFPAIAARALEDADLPRKVSAWEVIDWTLRETFLPEQRDLAGRFADPPITLYNSPRFHVDVYFWLEGTTAIHQHGFCGAFQVLHGSSLHSWYDFEAREKVNIFTEIGDIKLKSCRLLEVGDVQEIWAGRKYIHGLFHLDQPSATIVVRTYRSPLAMPQYNYEKPHLAIDPFFEEPATIKKLQALTALIRSQHPETDARIVEWLENADFQTSFAILSKIKGYLGAGGVDRVFNLSGAQNRFEKFLEVARKRHGERADVFPKVFRHHDKLNQILRQRALVADPEQRFFLALLLNVEGRERIFSLIKERFPETDALEKVLDWTYDLAQTKVFGSNMPNALGVEDFDDMDLFVLESLLKDRTEAEMLETLQTDYGTPATEETARNLAAKTEKIRHAVIFEPLLS
ncbi:MAG: hypothetical protein M3384_12080 [Acidobacteriota bacterium]|nr:hypothetical protein [Acidobacteriota bacterium]